ncbi:MAG TPA: nuclear transport factor 2 family protein [Thermodesulfobacteriota bacterium]|nr:nuclear transport factor 2 family protein [Thermodesulfobacteriota bacterium]
MSINKTNDKEQIREMLEDWAKKFRSKDLDGIMSIYAPDIVSYDAIAELQFKGFDAYRKHWEMCLSLCQGPITFEMRDLNITAGDGVAFAHSLNRCGGTDENGEEKASWMRGTICLKKIDGKWKVVHEHYSAPFDVESGKALFDLVP